MNSAGKKKRRRENVTQRASASIAREIPAPRRGRRPRVYFRRLVFRLVCHLTKVTPRGIRARANSIARRPRGEKGKRERSEKEGGSGGEERHDFR